MVAAKKRGGCTNAIMNGKRLFVNALITTKDAQYAQIKQLLLDLMI